MPYPDPRFDAPQRPNRALRLIFSYNGGQTKLESQHEVEMMALPSDPTGAYEGHSGFWVELRDAEERVVYRRITRNPIEEEHEAPSGDPSRPFTRVRTESDEGTFAVLVPQIESAEALVLCASPTGERLHAPYEITRVAIKEARQVPVRNERAKPGGTGSGSGPESPRRGKSGGRKGKK